MFYRSLPVSFSRCQARTVATFATFTPRFDDRCTARLQLLARAMYLIVATCFGIHHLTRETCITMFRNVFQQVVHLLRPRACAAHVRGDARRAICQPVRYSYVLRAVCACKDKHERLSSRRLAWQGKRRRTSAANKFRQNI